MLAKFPLRKENEGKLDFGVDPGILPPFESGTFLTINLNDKLEALRLRSSLGHVDLIMRKRKCTQNLRSRAKRHDRWLLGHPSCHVCRFEKFYQVLATRWFDTTCNLYSADSLFLLNPLRLT